MASQPRTCADCGAPLYPRNRSGYCRRHHNTNPEQRRKNSEAQKRACLLHPERREQKRRAGLKSWRDPAIRAWRTQDCRNRRIWERSLAVRTAETNAKIGLSVSATRLAWCPPHLREKYRALTRKGIPAAEARSAILEEHEIEMRRWRKSVGAEPVEQTDVTPSKGLLYIDRASAIAAEWAGVIGLWTTSRDRRVARARWAVYLALRRGGWTPNRIASETGMERKGVVYGLAKAEILASVPGEFADLLRRVAAA